MPHYKLIKRVSDHLQNLGLLPDASKFRRLGAQALIQFPTWIHSLITANTCAMKANSPVTFKILDTMRKLTGEFSENFKAGRTGGRSIGGS